MDTQSETLFFEVQQKTDKRHILDNPDTYVGSIEQVPANVWIFNDEQNKITLEDIQYLPALYKLFDESIQNCRDHFVRMKTKMDAHVEHALPVTYIDIGISEDGTITMTNDGNGIDVVKVVVCEDGSVSASASEATGNDNMVWIPELIFAHLRTSTNYNKEERKIVGGKNGFGFKLVLIWSTLAQIETIDHIRGLKYVQEFRNNLDIIGTPVISKTKCKPYTKMTFKPDYARLGIPGLSADMIALLKKRVYDITAVTDSNVKVKYNSVLIPTKNLEQYVNLYIGSDKTAAPRAYESTHERWEYAVALTPTAEFVQISFVNGIHTAKGGKHVDYIMGQITNKLAERIEKKKKIKVNPNTIKEQLILFLRCDIENPAFDSQTKDFMNTPASKFGSRCEVSDKFIDKLAKMGVMEAACAIMDVKHIKNAKKTDGSKTQNVRGIDKLVDANWAGTSKSNMCTLYLTEGDSAATALISGLSAEDRNTCGVFALKGKVMNVRDAIATKIAANAEISNLKKILGLATGKNYHDMEDVHKNLRYSHLCIVTDQDKDGSHIKGLCLNLFQSQWPSLVHIAGFIGFMNTPILKAKRGTEIHCFYNVYEYNEWKAQVGNDIGHWTCKYYKGLGTSTKKEWQEYFTDNKFVGFEHTGPECDDAMDMVFTKKRADDRKKWLMNEYDPNNYIDTRKPTISHLEFINRELIHFSKYDCERSIPNLMDGLKISLRKILFCAFKKRLNNEIKVAQFTGYVSEHSCYHHGEDSLNGAITGMAQNFIGSNNINLLVPNGQFGSRRHGGKDASSPRYIFTLLSPITRFIYPAVDDQVLKYLEDDGTSVEPQFYAPIIPMVLVNGSEGIGTGFSSTQLCYNPLDLIADCKNRLTSMEAVPAFDFIPYYDGYTGSIIKIEEGRYLFRGKYERVSNDAIHVSELPIGFWTSDFTKLLDELQSDRDAEGNKIMPLIKDALDNSTDSIISFTISFVPGKLEELEAQHDAKWHGCNGVEKLLHLFTTKTTTNMWLFDPNDKLKKYETPNQIIDDYFEIRFHVYQLRKQYLIQALEKDILVIFNQTKYIQELLNGTIDLRKKKKPEIHHMLESKMYDLVDESFHYLIKMPMDSVSDEKVEELTQKYNGKLAELENLRSTTEQQMWLSELDLLEVEYHKFKEERKQMLDGNVDIELNGKAKSKVKAKAGGKKMIKKIKV
jgi:DNA topoisomerase-2